MRPRLGQGAFRVAVTDAYGRSCAVTREHSLPVLEAPHIQPYAQGGAHDVRNGLLLRSDLHRLFDVGYVTVTPELRLEVSPRLRGDFANGRTDYPLHGSAVVVPPHQRSRPDPGLLRWHNESVYRTRFWPVSFRPGRHHLHRGSARWRECSVKSKAPSMSWRSASTSRLTSNTDGRSVARHFRH